MFVKRILFSVFAALLVAAVISCDSGGGGISINFPSTNNGAPDEDPVIVIPPQMGAITIKMETPDAARTLFPEVETYYYYVMFFDAPYTPGNSSVDETLMKTKKETFFLSAGDYIVRVYVCKKDDSISSEADAIEQSIAKDEFNKTAIENEVVELQAEVTDFIDFNEATKTGTLKYNIDLTRTGDIFFTAASMAIDTIAGQPAAQPIDFLSMPPHSYDGEIELVPGYYELTVNIKNFRNKTIVYREIAYIYQNMTTRFDMIRNDIDRYFSLAEGENDITVFIIMPDTPQNPLRFTYKFTTSPQYWYEMSHHHSFVGDNTDDPYNYVLTFNHEYTAGGILTVTGGPPDKDYHWYLDSSKNELSGNIIKGTYKNEIELATNDNMFNTQPLRQEYILSVRTEDGYQADVLIKFAFERN